MSFQHMSECFTVPPSAVDLIPQKIAARCRVYEYSEMSLLPFGVLWASYDIAVSILSWSEKNSCLQVNVKHLSGAYL